MFFVCGNSFAQFKERGQSGDQWGDNVESVNLLKTNAETNECTMAHVENAEMIEVDENDKIETVNLDLDHNQSCIMCEARSLTCTEVL